MVHTMILSTITYHVNAHLILIEIPDLTSEIEALIQVVIQQLFHPGWKERFPARSISDVF